jgi:hypothetical protein
MTADQVTNDLGFFSVYFTASEGGSFARGVTFVGGSSNDTVDVLFTVAPGVSAAVYTGPGADLVRVHTGPASGCNLLVSGRSPSGGASGDQLDVIDAGGTAHFLTSSAGAGNGQIDALHPNGSASDILYFDFEATAT